MSNPTLPLDIQKFISQYGYDYQDLNSIKVFSAKSSFSKFGALALILVGVFLLIGGLFFSALFFVGVLLLLVTLIKFLGRKRFKFDFGKRAFEIEGSIIPGKKVKYTFSEITGIEVNYSIAEGDVSAFSKNQKVHHYQIFLRAKNNKEHELFSITEKEFNPVDKVAAIKYTLTNWLNQGFKSWSP